MDVPKLLASEQRSAVERWVESNVRSVYLGESRALARVLGRYLMCLPTDDVSVVPHLLLQGYWEMWITMAVARLVQPGWHCIDVGANVGYYTLLLADIVGESGSVQAWELQADLCDCLGKSTHMNGVQSRVQVMNLAASDHDGFVKAAPLSAPWARGSVGTIPVEASERGSDATACSRLDDPKWRDDPSEVNFVKIDSEGHEPQVWEGMSGILQASPGVQVLLEFTPRLYSDPGAFLDRIQSDGFSLQRVDFDGELQATGPDQLLATDEMEMLWLGR